MTRRMVAKVAAGALLVMGIGALALAEFDKSRQSSLRSVPPAEASKFFGGGCAPGLDVIHAGCGETVPQLPDYSCEDFRFIYNENQQTESYHIVIPNRNCMVTVPGHGPKVCGQYDDLNPCGSSN